MNNKMLYLLLIVLIPSALMGCQKKFIYATSEISGQVINKQTDQPIEGVRIGINNQASDTTDEQGYFTVPPIIYEYTFRPPNHREVMFLGNVSMAIGKQGYEVKSYAAGGLAFIPKSYDEKNYINMGKVYLMPVPLGEESQNHTYYPTLDFCKPDQSQRQVDCIPVPEGKTYEQVSPNRTVE